MTVYNQRFSANFKAEFNKMNRKVDHIIVGQGLSGSILALTLLKKGKTVVLIDEAKPLTASKIAAGLYNPVVFKRLVESWMADKLLDRMNSFYPEMEALLGTKFYFSKRILKPFAEEQEKALWLKKTEEPIGSYLSKDIYTGDLDGVVYNPLGISEVLHAGNLDTTQFLSSSGNYFKENDLLTEEKFDHDQLEIGENSVTYKEITAGKVVFCEGYKTTENPFFSWLPFKLTKGETITIRLPETHSIPEDIVINKAVFVLPLGNNTYKVGATYEWDDLSEKISEKGRNELISKLEKVLKVPFEIIDQQAGIRPTVIDRRPLIGLHPEFNILAVFNGMGTKAVMLAPYFADQFADFLENGSPLDKEVDIARFK
jgi:glycine oxidase